VNTSLQLFKLWKTQSSCLLSYIESVPLEMQQWHNGQHRLYSFMREVTVIQQSNTGGFSCQFGVGNLHKQQETSLQIPDKVTNTVLHQPKQTSANSSLIKRWKSQWYHMSSHSPGAPPPLVGQFLPSIRALLLALVGHWDLEDPEMEISGY